MVVELRGKRGSHCIFSEHIAGIGRGFRITIGKLSDLRIIQLAIVHFNCSLKQVEGQLGKNVGPTSNPVNSAESIHSLVILNVSIIALHDVTL
jgi:hypothetical protein